MRLLVIVFFICVFLLGVIKIEDTDTWTHLNLGKQIFDHRGIPDKEPFVYPSLDKPFYDPEWLFDLIFYIAYRLFSLYGVILLKAFIITAVFYVLLKDSLVPHRNYIISVAALVFIVFMTRHRFVERPDIVLMLFLSFAIFALNSFVLENKKYIYFLPITQLLWVNMHPSISLIIVPFIAFIFGGLLQRFGNNRYNLNLPCTPSMSQLKIIGLIFFIVLIVSFINPYRAKPFFAPFELTSTDWFADEIMELQSPNWENYKSPYLLTAAIIISFLINIKRLSLIYLFMVIPFIYLSFSGLRFIFLLGIVGGPIVVRNVASQFTVHRSSFIVHSKEAVNNEQRTMNYERSSGVRSTMNIKRMVMEGVLIIGIILPTVLAISGVKPFSIPGKLFGFGINYDYFPEGALQYLDKRKITGRIFNTYQWGGYITWRDFPKRTVFVDGRGYLSNDLLEKLDLARSRAFILEEIQATYNFNVAILTHPIIDLSVTEIATEIDLSLSSKDWALVYWDDLSMVYLKRGGKLNDIIRQDEYRYVKPANGPYAIRAKLHDKEYLSNLIINELKRNINETNSSVGYAYLGFVNNEIGLYKEAIEALSMVRDFPFGTYLFSAYQGLGFAYGNLGYLDKSLEYYKKAFKLKKDATVMYNTGIAYIKLGDEKRGAKYLEDALKLNKNLLSIYPYLISIYQKLGKKERLEKTVNMYESARNYGEGEGHFQKGLKAYLEQKYELAIEEYKKSIKANPSNPTAYTNLGYIYYDIGIVDKAYEYQRRAIDLDPEFANAHYGLALIYKKWGDMKMAKRHWGEYLRIEPKGYFSRKAKEELKGL